MGKIIGIDPGFGRVGWGIIEGRKSDWKHVAHGLIETDKKAEFVDRLIEIKRELSKVIKKHKPSASAVEELFFYKNVTTGIKVGQARGVILLTLAEAGLEVFEYTPLQIKKAIVGHGTAQKRQVQKMLQMQFGIKKAIQDDAADALAAALTCGFSERM